MSLYETIILYRQDITTDQAEYLTAKSAAIIRDNGGQTVKAEYWGLRNLAYKINKNKKAHYVMLQSDTPHAAVEEMERLMRINEDVLRFVTFAVDELNTEDSLLMKESNGAKLFDLEVKSAPDAAQAEKQAPSAYHENEQAS